MSVWVSKFRMKGMPFSWFVFVYTKWHEEYCRSICCFLWGHEVPETTAKMLILYCVGSASVYQMLEWSCALHWHRFSKVSDEALFWWSHDSTHSQATKNIRTGFQLTMFSELLVVFLEFLWMPYCMCWQRAKIEGTLFSRLRIPEPSHSGIIETKSHHGTPITLIVSCCCQSWAVMTCF